MRIDKFTNVKDLTGDAFHELPYKIRTFFHENLSDTELRDFRQGNADATLLKKIQNDFNTFYAEAFPSDEKLRERHLEAQRQGKVDSLNRELKRYTENLNILDSRAKRDEVLPVGERQRLRGEIDRINKELETFNAVASPKQEDSVDSQDWVDKVLL